MVSSKRPSDQEVAVQRHEQSDPHEYPKVSYDSSLPSLEKSPSAVSEYPKDRVYTRFQRESSVDRTARTHRVFEMNLPQSSVHLVQLPKWSAQHQDYRGHHTYDGILS